jgi:hypothetical protein
MKKDELRLSLVIDVTYETGRASARELERTLMAAAEHLDDMGLLSGETEASVSTWSCCVVNKEDNEMKTTKIRSSHGSIEIETATGLVVNLLELDLATFGRTNVPVRFNIEEWYRRYPTRSLEDRESWDILDFGYWYYDHAHAMHVKYEEPDEEWREDRRLAVEQDLQS